jgi:tetratricopeptide (TPR) repeat protein
MNLTDIDFEKLLLNDFLPFPKNYRFSEEQTADLVGQADCIISTENENPQEQALAYVIKFQLLTWQHKLAPKLLEKALALYPDMPQALIRMGLFYYLKDRNKIKMLEYINKIIEISPSYADAWMFRAYLSEDDRKQFLSDCTEYIRLKPDSSFGYAQCVEYFHSQKRQNHDLLPDIITIFSMATEDNFEKYYKSFDTLFFRNEKIEEYCTEIISTVSSEKALYWLAYKKLAEYYFTQKNYKKSLATYSSMIEGNYKSSVFQLLGYSGRASTYKEMKNDDKALDDLYANKDKSIKGKAIKLEMIQKAIADLSKAIELAKLADYGLLLSDYYKERGDLYNEISELNNAIDDYSAAIKLNKKRYHFYMTESGEWDLSERFNCNFLINYEVLNDLE